MTDNIIFFNKALKFPTFPSTKQRSIVLEYRMFAIVRLEQRRAELTFVDEQKRIKRILLLPHQHH